MNKHFSRTCITLSALVFFTFSAQSQQKVNPKALALNNKAAKMVIDNPAKYPFAIQLLDSAITIQPKYFIAYANKINFYIKLKNFEAAYQTSKFLEQIQPSNPEAIFEEGYPAEISGHHAKAKTQYLKAMHLNKTKLSRLNKDDKAYIPTAVNYAMNLLFCDQNKESAQLISSILKQDPHNTAALLLQNKSHQEILKGLTNQSSHS